MYKYLGLITLCSAALWAQDGEKATVPLHDPRVPRIHAQLLSGGITVRGADVKDVTVEARGRGTANRRETRPPRTDGMKRLDISGSPGMDITEEDNVVTIKTASFNSPTDLVITAPRHSSLQLKCLNDGEIEVEGVEGEIDANDLNGKITLKNVSGSVIAHSLNGSVTAILDRVDASKPMSFSTMNGNIDVTLPANVKANVRMKTDNGDIYSDFDVKLDAGTPGSRSEGGRQPDGSYHLRLDRALRGTINGGGPEYLFTSFNGQIEIRKKK
jgi:hypothetical protein